MAQTPPPKNRLNHGLRDMAMSLLALLLIVGAVLVFSRGCSFDPGTPEADPSTAPSVDAGAAFARAAPGLDFPLRSPAVPAGWRANSTSTRPVEPVSVVVRVGWLTPDRYVQLSQSAAAPGDLVAVETGQESAPGGEVDVDGVVWTVYPGRRAEPVWVATFEGTTALITGGADDGEFRTLARAVADAEPLPRS